jgi:NADH dehydrogenase
MAANGRPRVAVVGGGFGGLYCAKRLERRLPPDAAEITVASAENYMTYTPLLPEASSGQLEYRHIVVPLRQVLRRARVLVGVVSGIDLTARTCQVVTRYGHDRTLEWDRLVIAPGSVTRLQSTRGLADYARGFKTVSEAVYLRNHVLEELEAADTVDDLGDRRAAATFVVIGAGYAGTELVAELEAMSRRAVGRYRRLDRRDLRWVLVNRSDRVLPELGPRLGREAVQVLNGRGVDVRLNTTVEEVGRGWVRLSDGETIRTWTLVWTAGVEPDPVVAQLGLPVNPRGHLEVDDVFALGDVAQVPDPRRPGQFTPPTAQHALRQANTCGDNLAASLGVGQPRPYRHRDLGLLVNLGEHYGIGRVFGVHLWGLPGWVMTRAYHLYALPTGYRRLRVGLDWLVGRAGMGDVAQLGSVGRADPRAISERLFPAREEETHRRH